MSAVRFVEIDAAGFIAEVGKVLQDRELKMRAADGVIRVSRVEFTIEYEGGQITDEGLPVLKRQGLNGEWPLALAMSDD